MEIPVQESKKCSKCDQTTNIEDFYLKDTKRNIRHSACKECMNVQASKYRNVQKSSGNPGLRAWLREYYLKNRDTYVNRSREYSKTPRGKFNKSKLHAKNKGKGFSPINSPNNEYDCHHLHINGSKDICIFIPRPLHKSVYHRSCTGKGMADINKVALLWLCEQSVI